MLAKPLFYRLIFFFFCLTSLFANPFQISFPPKKNLTHEDYIEIQKQYRAIDIKPLIQEMYQDLKKEDFTTFEDFLGRCTKSIHHTMIDPNKGLFPQKELLQIGKGGDRCFVCCSPWHGKYPEYIQSLATALKEVGFNGYFLYFLGGLPNPTGEEIQYAAVPYSFKIFAMVEAHLLGFNHVIWIDTACLPLKNPEPLFDVLEINGALLNWFPTPSHAKRYLFPQTHKLLLELSGTDVLNSHYISTGIFGLKMDSELTQKFIQIYYEYVKLGTPFLSCFPEEWVFTAIIGKPQFRCWKNVPPVKFFQGSLTNAENCPKEYDAVRKKGFYFYLRKGR